MRASATLEGRWFVLLQYGALVLGLIGVSFGVIIAIAAHVGISSELDRVVESVGADRLRLETLPENHDGFAEADLRSVLELPYVASAAADTAEYLLSNPREHYTLTYVGVTPSYFDTRKIPLASGRPFEAADENATILGYDVAAALFDGDAVGRVLDTGTQQYTVIGTLAYVPIQDRRADSALNTSVFLPVEAMAARMGRPSAPFDMIWIHVQRSRIDDAIAELSEMFAGRGRIREMSDVYRGVISRGERTSQLLDVAAVLFVVLSALLSIVVGSDIVRRSSHHGGLHRALGATRRHIALAALGRFALLTACSTGVGATFAASVMPMLGRFLAVPLRFGALHFAGLGILSLHALGVGAYLGLRAAAVSPMTAIRMEAARGQQTFLVEYALTVLALAIGIGAVLFLVAFSDHMRSLWAQASGPIDADVLSVRSGPAGQTLSFLPEYALERDDAEAIAAVGGVDVVTGEVRSRRTVRSASSSMLVDVLGLYSIGRPWVPATLSAGRLPTTEEYAGGARVVLIGASVADRLFEDENPVADSIAIEGTEFTVVGLCRALVPPTTRPTIAPDAVVLVPQGSLPELVGEHILWAHLSAAADPVSVAELIARQLHERHPGAAPAVVEGSVAAYGVFAAFLFRMVSGFLVLAALAALVSIGGILSLSWTRTLSSWHSFGIHRTLGQTRLRTFLAAVAPAVWTSIPAGALAFALSILALGAVSRMSGTALTVRPVWVLWTALAVLVAASIGGGIPALWAARLDPAETIRTGRQ